MKVSIHRLFLVAVVVFAALWAWAAVMVSKHKQALDVYSKQVYEPEINRFKRATERMEREMKAGSPLSPVSVPSDTSFDGMMERRRELDYYRNIRELAMLGLIIAAFCWQVAAQIQRALRRRARATVERTSEPNAGHLIGDLVSQGRSFIARAKPDGATREIEIDGKRRVVVFRNLTFVTGFVGNKLQPIVELPFSELLVTTTSYSINNAFLFLRTTAGRVSWSNKVQPFDTLASLLDDIVELNRNNPDAYRAARAREPSIRTSWYGWVILATAIAAIAAGSWYILYHT